MKSKFEFNQYVRFSDIGRVQEIKSYQDKLVYTIYFKQGIAVNVEETCITELEEKEKKNGNA